MNRLDTSTPLAEVSDFVLELAQPDGSTARVCVSVGTQPISLAVFLSLLSQQGVIARGGGNPARSARLASAARQRGLLMDIDDGGEYPSYGYEDEDGADDPFRDGPPARRMRPVIDPRPLRDPFADEPDTDTAAETEPHTFQLKPRETLCDRCLRASNADPSCRECALVLENAIRQGGRL